MPRRTYPDGLSVPAKRGYFLATLLTGRENFQPESTMRISSEATAIHVRGTRLALAGLRLNRMTTDGTSGGLELYGPVVQGSEPRGLGTDYFPKQPHALAFSPDYKYLYLTGYVWSHNDLSSGYSLGYWCHAVLRMEYAKNDPPQVFLGQETGRGADDAHFDHPVDIATDDAGRLYVADQVNNRVQIFNPDGKLVKSLAVEGPARVRLNPRTQELYVFSHFTGRDWRPPRAPLDADIKPTLRVFAPFPGLELRQACPIPLRRYQTTTATNSAFTNTNMHYQFALDCSADPPRILAILEEGGYPELLELRKEGLVKIRDFLDDAKQSGVRLTLAGVTRQRMYVDPQSGMVYLGEGDSGSGKSFTNLLRIDPVTGRCQIVELPFSASDAVFSPDGALYLRTGDLVGRYNLETGKEIPFDYGEEREAIYSWDTRHTGLVGALRLPSTKTSPSWHHGGMDVNARGDLLVTCFNPNSVRVTLRKERRQDIKQPLVEYRPVLYPGRWASGHELQTFDPYGRPKHRDLLKGQPRIVAGVGLDVNDNVYANFAVSLMYQGQPYWKLVGHRFDQVGTLAKFKPGAGKFISRSEAHIPLENPPDRPQELDGFWVDGAEWFYPGVGRTNWTMDCTCWNSRIVLDYFARTFAPEYDRFSIAVLDTNGNLITRIGR